ncbi:MAG TPA: HAD-IC family P-type ATPase, partial [bacterium]|nr:HAD-IC family P-type ATPase [bacterium]
MSSISEIEKNLDTSVSSGLTEKQAIERLGVYGHNRLVKKKKRPTIFLFFEQFRSFIIWILIVAAIISGLLQEWIDTFAIIGIVILNAFLGFIQEFKAEKALEGLKKLFSHYTRVIREGFVKTIPSELLVPGDIIEIEAGDNISADCRVVWHTSNFTVQEASLTGESVPVFKTNMPLNDPDAIIGDRNNMVYMGTNVASGRAKCVVVNTGMETELGKITEMIQEEKYEKTPLQEKLEGFGKSLVYICLGLVGIIFLMEYARGGKFVDVFLTSVSLAVAAVPEGLPAVVTIGLALGVQRMAKRNVLIRKLPSVETLGCATVICSDKTGTLTKNEMTVTKIYADDTIFDVTGTGYCPQGHFMVNEKPVDVENFPGLGKSLLCATICNISNLVNKDGNWEVVGDPTEGALLVAAAKAGKIKEQIDKDFKIVDEIPFDSERKRMSVIVKYKQETLIFIKGAPDVLLNLCSFIDENGIVRPLDDFTRQKITNIINSFAEKALRIIATGYRKLESNVEITQENIEKDIIFSGLLAMIDPPRDEAKAAIQK